MQNDKNDKNDRNDRNDKNKNTQNENVGTSQSGKKQDAGFETSKNINPDIERDKKSGRENLMGDEENRTQKDGFQGSSGSVSGSTTGNKSTSEGDIDRDSSTDRSKKDVERER